MPCTDKAMSKKEVDAAVEKVVVRHGPGNTVITTQWSRSANSGPPPPNTCSRGLQGLVAFGCCDFLDNSGQVAVLHTWLFIVPSSPYNINGTALHCTQGCIQRAGGTPPLPGHPAYAQPLPP